MSANKIGSLQFNQVQGTVDLLATQIEQIERLGIDGTAFWDTGNRAIESMLTSWVDIATGSAVDTFFASCKALQGTSVTVYDCFSNGYTNVMIIEVLMTRTDPVGLMIGGQNATPEAIAYFQWRVKQSQ